MFTVYIQKGLRQLVLARVILLTLLSGHPDITDEQSDTKFTRMFTKKAVDPQPSTAQ